MNLARRGFSLLELVIVIVILGIIAAIALPRMGSAAENSANKAVAASTAEVQHAIELYSTEHTEQDPSMNPDGSVNNDPSVFISRLLGQTDDQGNVDPAGIYGPYLRAWPVNPVNSKSTLRIGGLSSGLNTDGWQFDPATRTFSGDQLPDGGSLVTGNPGP
jgi:general secretion pathway protein G/type IV pilus assembly protein PilA